MVVGAKAGGWQRGLVAAGRPGRHRGRAAVGQVRLLLLMLMMPLLLLGKLVHEIRP
jgi:hypothetical protein